MDCQMDRSKTQLLYLQVMDTIEEETERLYKTEGLKFDCVRLHFLEIIGKRYL